MEKGKDSLGGNYEEMRVLPFQKVKADKNYDWSEKGILCKEKMYYTRETDSFNKLCSNSVEVYF